MAPAQRSFGAVPTTPTGAPWRYKVREVLWGSRRRFVVHDVATGTTIAIRTTRHVADSDMLRLNMRRIDCRPGDVVTQDADQTVPASPPTDDHPDRQCGRCRRFFDADPTLTPATIQDWWLCEACHDNLMGVDRRIRSTPGSVAST